ncbi:hypothetical protein DFQ28_002170 [Apophysomyces sp. BC1034]|nr:hypothetical protein DFQ30_001859 [Apophysomyces sp. BC1015]KAG0180496.1 hypothetical protein DFQ29_000585 [Apophysomyces sp. BC1021]KAG0190355.1 hypothetical protein DFQ28_002170 [Apophysomyces sp. BC1034]
MSYLLPNIFADAAGKLQEYVPSSWMEDTVILYYAIFLIIMIPGCAAVIAPYGRFTGCWKANLSFHGKWSWFIMEVIPVSVFLHTAGLSLSSTQWLLASLWLIHYFNRAIIYPIRAPSLAPLHIAVLAAGSVFNGLNGYTNGRWLASHDIPNTPKLWIGVSIWFAGLCFNIYHDSLLFRLRRSGKGYFIPRGGLFEYVSCANYLSEMIEWTGYAIATWPCLPAFLFVVTTAGNLVPRALYTHRWYRQKFEDYPRNRKAVVPYLL